MHRAVAAFALALTAACAASGSSPLPETNGEGGVADDASIDARLDDASVRDGDATTTPDASVHDGAPPDAGAGILGAAIACIATGNACTAPTPVAGIFATYRKDVSLPDAQYAEQGAAPANGGRFHIAAIASASGAITRVELGGQDVTTLFTAPHLEWLHAWPHVAVAGEPIWIAFHSQDPAWDSATSGHIRVVTANGDAVNGAFPVARAVAPLTYVTTTDDRKTLVVHVQNGDAVPHTLARLVVNGRDVSTPSVACIPKKTLAPHESAMWTVPLCAAAALGGAWTVVTEWSGAPASVGVGRVVPELFPIESWTSTSDCAFPGANAANFAKHQAAGIDTHFMYIGGGQQCGFSAVTMANVTAPAQPDFRVFIADDFLSQPAPETLLTDTSRVTGFLIGDEVDGKVYDGTTPKPHGQAQQAERFWNMYPGLPVYQGGKTNKNVGAFAGATDIQGMDFYAAACAPHITQFGTHPPLRGPYDYLRNARNNHMPLPTWLYSQGLSGGWDKHTIGTAHVQADPQELLVQALSVMAAGGKGLMWFQSTMDEATYAPRRWDALAQASWTFRGVRAFLREGDVTGAATTDVDAIVESIRARDAIVVPVVAVETTTGPTDVGCAATVTEAQVVHWMLVDRTATVSVVVPDDFAVAEVFEVKGQQVLDVTTPRSVTGRTLRLDGIALGNAAPVRVFVLARTTAVRQVVVAALMRKANAMTSALAASSKGSAVAEAPMVVHVAASISPCARMRATWAGSMAPGSLAMLASASST